MKLVAKLINGNIDIVDIESYNNTVKEEYELLKVRNSVQDSVIDAILAKNEKKRSKEELLKIVTRKRIDDIHNQRISQYSDYLPLKEEEFTGELKEGYFKRPKFREEDGFIIESYEADVDISYVKRKIEEKQEKLSSTDYMIIKTYEAKIIGEPAPYSNINDVIKERQTLRDEIEELNKLLNVKN